MCVEFCKVFPIFVLIFDDFLVLASTVNVAGANFAKIIISSRIYVKDWMICTGISNVGLKRMKIFIREYVQFCDTCQRRGKSRSSLDIFFINEYLVQFVITQL